MIDRLPKQCRIRGWRAVVAPQRRRRFARVPVGLVVETMLRFALMPVTDWLLALCAFLGRIAVWSREP